MAYRYFPGKNRSWLVTKLDEVNDQLAAGKMATAANAGDQGASFQRETNLRSIQQQILWDLHQSDPEGGWDSNLLPTVTRGTFVARDDGWW